MKVPVYLCISADTTKWRIPAAVGRVPQPKKGETLWRITSHPWARRNPDKALWMPAMCGNDLCAEQVLQEAGHCIGHDPHEACGLCAKPSIPYRQVRLASRPERK